VIGQASASSKLFSVFEAFVRFVFGLVLVKCGKDLILNIFMNSIMELKTYNILHAKNHYKSEHLCLLEVATSRFNEN